MMEAGIGQHQLHGLLVQDIVGPAAVGRFDEELLAELGGLEVDVIKSDELGHLVEETLGANEEGLERHAGLDDYG